ncbi:CmpA/NrtA family ABC transporter substrate-binding protein [Tropicimonas isoalkanivorans]|uniref:NitT/TauT family transport system ATP-binding protein n=1 Tax=Tropicimonas isoalkanivorans TaxID=441112 RepID=A0A1I1DIL1_9RHOB|nr:CmpA/NrtA family ABC transporter substrate-binding protein [Tropicimonas isoalkanivorans]SFB74674.1 NitT/TauT family transport system ATP-binding protein [Tropicimonas isoalkanivorans]
MSTALLEAGFIPLVDAAPFVVAHEIGFAEEEGLALRLHAAPSWATLRDMLILGRVDAAHMLSAMPVAMALGLGGVAARIDVLSVLSVNGNAIGVSGELAQRMRAAGYRFDFADAAVAGRALLAAAREEPRIGVPFPFSMHAELLYHWLGALGVAAPQALRVVTVPPPLMAQAMAAGEIDAFCVGAPWGSMAVENGVGELLLPTSAIRAFAPEKVLAVRHDWAEAEPELARRLMRALWRASKWLDQPENHSTASELLARREYLNVPAEVIERSLSGRLVISPRAEIRAVENYLLFHRGAAAYPWRSHGALIARSLAERSGLDGAESAEAGRAIFRTDLFRRNLRDLGAEIPGATDKVEGALGQKTAVASESGKLILEPDAFFDGFIFDPNGES